MSDLRDEAKQVLLEGIKEAGADATASDLLRLAEAWAWLISPNNSHGGGNA